MINIVNRLEMESIDKAASEKYAIPSTILMENAGIAIAQKILEIITDKSKSIGVLVGPGNNGGDGLVIARYLQRCKISIQVYLFAPKEKFKGDALLNLEIAEKYKIPMKFIKNEDMWEIEKSNVLKNCYLIDSLFGTGMKDEPRPFFKKVIENLNAVDQSHIISVDVPSGLICEFDIQNKTILKANSTIAVSLPKAGMLDYPGKSYIGDLHIVDIGFPVDLTHNPAIQSKLINRKSIQSILPKRKKDGHKGSFGRLLVIAGSNQYSGASVLTVKSALKSGLGLVTLSSSKSSCDVLRNHLPEAITLELCDYSVEDSALKNFKLLEDKLNQYSAIIFGPGIGLNDETFNLLKLLLENYKGKLLIDADGLNHLSHCLDYLNTSEADIVLTPHIKEMARLVHCSVEELLSKKVSIARGFAKKYNIHLVLKSAVTLTASPDNTIYFNSTGNEGMATGGSGDVLSGLIGGLMAQGLSVLNSSISGVFIHGFAGDFAKEKLSSHSMTASDIIENFHLAFKELE